MKQSILSEIRFHSEEAAYEYIESVLWPGGPVCPHCGHNKAYPLKSRVDSENKVRAGLYKCAKCRKQFTVKVGTIFEDSHIPLRKWLQGLYLIASSKKGVSCNQLSRTLGISLKSA